ncbi:MAG: hypothetical protein JWP87_3452 [Labilithrix sp.]|nr:hypothetical protein [Labilithrix sp.]
MSNLDFSRRLPLVVHRTTFVMKVRRIFDSYPRPMLGLVGVLLFIGLMRTAKLVGLLMFPLFALARAVHRQEKAERALGVVPVVVDTANVPPIALVTAGKGGLSIEGMKITLSRASLLPAIVDEQGTTIFVRTKRDLPNFTFTFDDASDGRAFLTALGQLDAPTPAKASAPALLERGDLTIAAWVERLRAQDQVDYRSTRVLPDDLWRVLEDGDATLSSRAAAAIALAPLLDKAARERWRAIRTDSPYRLRVAMKAARGAELPAIAKALEACLDD